MYRVLLDDVSENREKFVEIHQDPSYYGSSTVADIAGLNPYRSRLQAWVIKKQGICEDLSKNIRIRRGIAMEPVLAELFTEVTGKAVLPFNQVLQHKSYDWAIASPDYCTVGEHNLVECKCVSYRGKHFWEGGGAPDYYMIQLQWQMGISGIHFWILQRTSRRR
jgi:putative phage-type endonuclease